MIDKILSDTDNNSRGEVNAVLATLYDWKEAFPRQCPKLGIEAFIKCGVRPSLIPLLISYLQNRTYHVITFILVQFQLFFKTHTYEGIISPGIWLLQHLPALISHSNIESPINGQQHLFIYLFWVSKMIYYQILASCTYFLVSQKLIHRDIHLHQVCISN